MFDVIFSSKTFSSAGGQTPVIGKVDGDYQFDQRKTTLIWSMPVIDKSNSEGSLEFTMRGKSNDFFPIRVDFVAETPFCDIKVRRSEETKEKRLTKFSFSFSRLPMLKQSTLENRSDFPRKQISSSKNTNMFRKEHGKEKLERHSHDFNLFFLIWFIVIEIKKKTQNK